MLLRNIYSVWKMAEYVNIYMWDRTTHGYKLIETGSSLFFRSNSRIDGYLDLPVHHIEFEDEELVSIYL